MTSPSETIAKAMEGVTRYANSHNQNGLGFSNGITEDENGGYVRYDAYQALARQTEEMQREIAEKEDARAEQWRKCREAEASRDAAYAAADSMRTERNATRAALADISEGWDFWEASPHDREPPRDAIRRARSLVKGESDAQG